MKKLLGKKNNSERGTFMAYSCACSCFNLSSCGTCKNCSTYKRNDYQGKVALTYVNNTKMQTQSMTVPAIMG